LDPFMEPEEVSAFPLVDHGSGDRKPNVRDLPPEGPDGADQGLKAFLGPNEAEEDDVMGRRATTRNGRDLYAPQRNHEDIVKSVLTLGGLSHSLTVDDEG